MTEKQLRKKLGAKYPWDVPIPAVSNHWKLLSAEDGEPPGTYIFRGQNNKEETVINIKRCVFEKSERLGIKTTPLGFGLIKAMFNQQSMFIFPALVKICIIVMYMVFCFSSATDPSGYSGHKTFG